MNLSGLITSGRVNLSTAPEPIVTDPYWSSVVLRATLDGTNGSAVITNLASSNTPTAGSLSNNAAGAIVTGDSAYGASGSSYATNGTGYITSANAIAYSGNFTIEGWVKFTANLTWTDPDGFYNANFFGPVGLTMNAPAIGFTRPTASGPGMPTAISFSRSGTGAGAAKANSISVAMNTWYYIAGVRDGNTASVYFNGVRVATADVTGLSYATAAASFGRVGFVSYLGLFPGRIDDLRITTGVARYSGTTMPVPTTQLPTQ